MAALPLQMGQGADAACIVLVAGSVQTGRARRGRPCGMHAIGRFVRALRAGKTSGRPRFAGCLGLFGKFSVHMRSFVCDDKAAGERKRPAFSVQAACYAIISAAALNQLETTSFETGNTTPTEPPLPDTGGARANRQGQHPGFAHPPSRRPPPKKGGHPPSENDRACHIMCATFSPSGRSPYDKLRRSTRQERHHPSHHDQNVRRAHRLVRARFHRRRLARMQRGQQRRQRFLKRLRPGNAARRWPALLHQRRRCGNRVLRRGAFPGPQPCRRHHSALLSRWRKPRFLLYKAGTAWVPDHRDGSAAHAQRRRCEFRRHCLHQARCGHRRFEPRLD